MRRTDRPTTGTPDRISLAGRQVEFRLIPSRFATKLRVRVGVTGVEVIQPEARGETEVSDFLRTNAAWIVSQLERVEGFRNIRRPRQSETGQILFRGELTTVGIEEKVDRTGTNRINYDEGRLVIRRSSTSGTPPARALRTG
jgi:predicted metal-dependent hydrolase